MGDSLDDLDFPKCAEQLMAMPTMRRLGHKPLPLGAVKRWRFCFRLEDGQSMYIGTDGNLDSISEYIGTEPEARWESERRLIEFERSLEQHRPALRMSHKARPTPVFRVGAPCDPYLGKRCCAARLVFFFGLPPRFPFSRAAAAFASEVLRPPRRPSS